MTLVFERYGFAATKTRRRMACLITSLLFFCDFLDVGAYMRYPRHISHRLSIKEIFIEATANLVELRKEKRSTENVAKITVRKTKARLPINQTEQLAKNLLSKDNVLSTEAASSAIFKFKKSTVIKGLKSKTKSSSDGKEPVQTGKETENTISASERKHVAQVETTNLEQTLQKEVVSTAVLQGDEPHNPRRPFGFPLVKASLLHYQLLYGNMLVPTSFTVPADKWGWPKECWNIRLGIVVQTIRRGSYADRKQELIEMGFCYDVYKERYKVVLAALLAYKKLHGNLLVPQHYVVPSKSEAYHKDALGLKLGSVVHSIRQKEVHSHHKEELISIGFDYSSQSKVGWNTFKTAMAAFTKIYNHTIVSEPFVIPSNSTKWPKETWGLKLGATVDSVKRNYEFKDKREELIKMDFCFDKYRARYHVIRETLLHYKKVHGDMLVPIRYIVPSTPEWPLYMWGVNLGGPVHGIRRGTSFRNKKEDLLSIGFVYVVRKKFPYEDVKIAVYKYRELHHGSVDIPAVYNIPHDDPWYPEETWGMRLGSYALRIKKGSIWSDKSSELFGKP